MFVLDADYYNGSDELLVADESTAFDSVPNQLESARRKSEQDRAEYKQNSEVFSYSNMSKRIFYEGAIDTLTPMHLINPWYPSKELKQPKGKISPLKHDKSPAKASRNNNQERSSINSQKSSDSGLELWNTVRIPEKLLRDWGCASILIVDDSPFNILILHEIFNKITPPEFGRWAEENDPRLLIDEATNGLQAVNKVKETISKSWWRGYEIVLMDLNMPVMDGATAAKNIVQLQKDEWINSELRVVALTAYDSPEHKSLCFASGMTGFMNKPVSILDIVNVLQSYIV